VLEGKSIRSAAPYIPVISNALCESHTNPGVPTMNLRPLPLSELRAKQTAALRNLQVFALQQFER
jgi:hypothetical protein